MSNKKKDKKIKRKQKLENIVKEEEISYDIIRLLNTERMDSKPNIGKFLQSYVKEIRIFNSTKITVYPVFGYKIDKVFVKFLDGHELIWDCNANKSEGFETPEFYYYDRCDEIELKKKDIETIKGFFDFLIQFKFIY